MALVPTFRLRKYRDYDGDVRLQQLFLEGGVAPVWQDVPLVDYHDEEEVERRAAEAVARKGKKKSAGMLLPVLPNGKDS
jgi:hypothetical protein